MKSLIDQRVKSKDLKPKEGVSIQKFYEDLLSSYTYVKMESEGSPTEDSQVRLREESVGKLPSSERPSGENWVN